MVGPDLSLALAAASLNSGPSETQKQLIYRSLNSVNTLQERVFVVVYLLYVGLSERRDILTADPDADGVWSSLRTEDDVAPSAECPEESKAKTNYFLLNKFRQLASDLSVSSWLDWVEVAPPASAYLKVDHV